jgi:hypothetical protein
VSLQDQRDELLDAKNPSNAPTNGRRFPCRSHARRSATDRPLGSAALWRRSGRNSDQRQARSSTPGLALDQLPNFGRQVAEDVLAKPEFTILDRLKGTSHPREDVAQRIEAAR